MVNVRQNIDTNLQTYKTGQLCKIPLADTQVKKSGVLYLQFQPGSAEDRRALQDPDSTTSGAHRHPRLSHSNELDAEFLRLLFQSPCISTAYHNGTGQSCKKCWFSNGNKMSFAKGERAIPCSLRTCSSWTFIRHEIGWVDLWTWEEARSWVPNPPWILGVTCDKSFDCWMLLAGFHLNKCGKDKDSALL